MVNKINPQLLPDKECLFVSDLDGTLLRPDGSFPEDYKKRLNRLLDSGLRFTIATARNYDSAHPILHGLNLNLPVILFNGVYLADFHSGNILENSSLINKPIVENMLDLALSQNIDPFIYALGEQHKLYYQGTTNSGSQAYIRSLEGDRRLQQVNGFKDFKFPSGEKVFGFLLIDTHDRLEPIYQSLQETHFGSLNLYFAKDVSTHGHYWLQAFHQEANKGNMLKTLTHKLGIPLNRTVVFGDYPNDLEMFRVAGHAIAMGNALPEVKDSAQEVIGCNSQGAVLQYLESIWLEK
ncbi:MAG: Cof-type HAD-IIB family hydrolase [Nitrospinaceae bacterium]|nr:Cof-type HAD-IIB family hydrolase [Nitrospina sp.]MBT5375710.1 Cof-type HAD-IIB family hydrolase [Nitrospinaceae bacterium]MBT6345607.1 Cof-type HAD-IIB family hydrolase [Nitrospina sp.]